MPERVAKILVVDDDDAVSALLEEILSSQGYEVRVAHDGAEGLRMLHERRPDAVILDVEMPHLSGPEMAYRMFITDTGLENVPIVLVSGVVGFTEVARRVGTPYYLPKPFRLDDLFRVLSRALEERIAPTPAP